jgi:hypothetical protein
MYGPIGLYTLSFTPSYTFSFINLYFLYFIWASSIDILSFLLFASYIPLLQRLKFYKRLCVSTNYFMRDLFWNIFITNLQSETNIEQIFHTCSELTVFLHNEFNCMCVSLWSSSRIFCYILFYIQFIYFIFYCLLAKKHVHYYATQAAAV